jgi:GST-like protein
MAPDDSRSTPTATARCTLYGSRGSGSAAVEMALVRCGVAFDLVTASSWEPASAQAALAALNPLRQIPTLVWPDGSVMTESAAILIELGLRFPDAALLPPTPAARAVQLRGLVYIAANCYANVSLADYPERWLPRARSAARERLRAGARAQLHHAWELFADQWKPAPWLAGDRPGALDLLTVVVSSWPGTRAHLAQARPPFAEWLLRLEAHPDVASVLRRHRG